MHDFYAELKQSALRLTEAEFVAWVKGPVLLLDHANRSDEAWIPGSATSIVSTVAFQGAVDSVVVEGEPVDSEDGSRTAHRLNAKEGGTITIGRSDECDIAIDHHSISQVHAELSRGPGGAFQIADPGSRNGVTINGRRIAKGTPHRIEPSDVIRIGATMARVVYPKPLYALLHNKKAPASVWRPLRDRTYLALWAGEAFGFFADGLFRIAIVSWAIEATGSGAVLSTLAVCTIVSLILSLLFGGVLVDTLRLSRARVLLLSVAMRALVVGTLAFIQLHGGLALWQVYAGAALLGFAEGLFVPNNTAILPEIVRREDLPSANSLTTISFFCASIIGPSLASLLVYLGGTSLAFSIVAVAFLLSCLCIAQLPAITRSASAAKDAEASSLGEAARFLFSQPWLWITSLSYTLAHCVSLASAAVALPVLIDASLELDIGFFGVCQSLMSVGGLIGALSLGKRLRSLRRGPMAYLMCFVIGCCIVAVGLPITIYGIGAVWLIRGFAYVVFRLIWVGTLQDLVPQRLLGRAASLDAFGQVLFTVVTFLSYGWAIGGVEPEALFIVGGSIPVLVAVLALAHPRIRSFR